MPACTFTASAYSTEIKMTNLLLTGILIPSTGWSSAGLVVLASFTPDADDFAAFGEVDFSMVDAAVLTGFALSATAVAAIADKPVRFKQPLYGMHRLKFLSGTVASPVTQTAVTMTYSCRTFFG